MSWIELIIGISIFAILSLFNLTSSSQLFCKNHIEARMLEINHVLNFAKNQALIRGQNLALVPFNENDGWSSGMKLFIDNPQHKPKDDSELIYTWQWKHSMLHIDWRGFQSSHLLLISPDLSQNAMNGVFMLKERGMKAKLVVNRLGRVRIDNP